MMATLSISFYRSFMTIVASVFGKFSLFTQSIPKRSARLGALLGFFFSLALPRVGVIFVLNHLVRATVWRAAGVMTKGLLLGTSIGIAFDLLKQSGWVHSTNEGQIVQSNPGLPAVNWRLTEMLRLYGYEHQSFLSLYGGMEVWWLHEPEAAIVYRRVKQVLIVVGAPLAAKEDWPEVTERFLNYCRQQKLSCLMVPFGEAFADVARASGMGLIPVGESGYFQLLDWKPTGDRAKKIRAGANQARKAGVVVEYYRAELAANESTRAEVERLCRAWLGTRELDALGWLLELNPFKLSEHKRYFLARDANGQLKGLLACSPIYARRGWYLEDLIRCPEAERGVSELLVTEALKHLAAEGAELATLGTSPLAGIKAEGQFKNTERLLKLIYQHFDAFYHFKSLHRFKSKFAPSFVEKEYLAVYPPKFRLKPVFALIEAFEPDGLPGLIASKLRRSNRPAQ